MPLIQPTLRLVYDRALAYGKDLYPSGFGLGCKRIKRIKRIKIKNRIRIIERINNNDNNKYDNVNICNYEDKKDREISYVL